MLVLGYLLISVGLTWIYRMGKSDNDEWMAQGVRFGLAIAIVATIPSFMIAYVVERIPESLAIKQIVAQVDGRFAFPSRSIYMEAASPPDAFESESAKTAAHDNARSVDSTT